MSKPKSPTPHRLDGPRELTADEIILIQAFHQLSEQARHDALRVVQAMATRNL